MLPYVLCLILFFVGLYGLIVKKNLLKIIISFIILDNALNLFLIVLGYKKGAGFPIFLKNVPQESMVDPVPQALVLTSIVIGLSVTILMIAVALRLYEKYKTFDVTEIKNLKG
ncbi:MAG: cation:proton antiporter subunit C [Endomicrobia bacterium]|nr:cation:proton antiporter subunit C [Endomicrobiia bacterium]MCX7716618.1 cation:proton antiporter subunit C [Endomicrobiia bacterium]